MGEKKLIKVADVAAYFNVPAHWVYRQAALGLLPKAQLPGRLLRFDPDVIYQLSSAPSSLKTKEKGERRDRKPPREDLWS